MRHRVAGRHFGRPTDHRLSMYRNLVTDLLRHERITTTEAKAKEIRPMAEKMITLGKRGDVHARRQALAFMYDTKVVKKVFDEIGPRMANRPGGYTRITALETRKGDGAKIATIELIDFVDAPATPRPQRVTAAPVAAPAAAAAPVAASAAAPAAEAVAAEPAPEPEVAAGAPEMEEASVEGTRAAEDEEEEKS